MQLTELSIRSQNLFIRDYIEEKKEMTAFLTMISILSTHGKRDTMISWKGASRERLWPII